MNQKRRVMTDALAREVADIYLGCESGGLTEVERQLGVSRSTAARWVKAARARGLIPPLAPSREMYVGKMLQISVMVTAVDDAGNPYGYVDGRLVRLNVGSGT